MKVRVDAIFDQGHQKTLHFVGVGFEFKGELTCNELSPLSKVKIYDEFEFTHLGVHK